MTQQTQPANSSLVSANGTAESALESTPLPKPWDLKPQYIGSSPARILAAIDACGKPKVFFIDELTADDQAKR